jgi:hypothetical protein
MSENGSIAPCMEYGASSTSWFTPGTSPRANVDAVNRGKEKRRICTHVEN